MASLVRNMTLEQKVGQMTQLNINLFLVEDSDPFQVDVERVRFPTAVDRTRAPLKPT